MEVDPPKATYRSSLQTTPQLDSHIEDDVLVRPLYFAFRYKELDSHDIMYLRLINSINEFDQGNLTWIMYKYKFRNYVIEPLEFYLIRRKMKSGSDEKLIQQLGPVYQPLMYKAVDDLQYLAAHIRDTLI